MSGEDERPHAAGAEGPGGERAAGDGDTPVGVASAPAASGPEGSELARKPWGAPIDRFDRGWTKLEARLAATVLVTEILLLVGWIALKAMSSTGRDGAGQLFRSLVTALVFGGIAHLGTRKQKGLVHPIATTAAFVVGWTGGRFWGDAGVAYFANLLAWMQNASLLVFFGGVSELAKRLTLWLALLGASIATAQGKHINVDVVMRFLTPRARVPVALVGWLAAAVVSLAAAWGFFDAIAVEEFHAPTSVPCPADATRSCPAPAGTKIARVLHDTERNTFLATRQISLDLRALPRVLGGTHYASWLTPQEWNAWLRGADWEKRFPAEDVKGLELPEDGSVEFRTPAVTSVPGGTERVHMLLVPLMNLVFPFGLLVIAIRFVVRSLLALSGWIKVDPAAAHGDDELATIHDHSPEALAAQAAIKETVR